MQIVYDGYRKRPIHPDKQHLYGGDAEAVRSAFPPESWLPEYTKEAQVYQVDEAQLAHLVEVTKQYNRIKEES